MEKKTIGERKPAILSITRCVSVTFNLALRAIDISMADLPPREMVERGREGGEEGIWYLRFRLSSRGRRGRDTRAQQ